MKAKIIVTLYIKNVTGALYTVNYNENTLSVSVSVNAAWNRNLCGDLLVPVDYFSVTSAVSLKYTQGGPKIKLQTLVHILTKY